MLCGTLSVDNNGVPMSIIYQITCVTTGKFYIGSTMNKAQRWARHRRELRLGKHVNKHLQASWSKYGEAAFEFSILEEVKTQELLFVVEQRYLDKHVGSPECFNWSKYAGAPMRGKSGAETPNFGKAMPESTKQKISNSIKGENHPNWGKKTSEERKKKISESNLANPNRFRKHTPEAIAKIAAASKGRPVSEETRAKRSLALKGREISTAQRLQISRTLSGEGNFWYGKKRPESFSLKVRKPVATYRDGVLVKVYGSIKALREEFKATPTTVNRLLKSGVPAYGSVFGDLSVAYLAPPIDS
jgi:group I intron endonuclease